ncbi:MAG: hypothetical protein KGS61_02165, partial [Verrucomicrobia bacterium]|nr:hypothetical protein [Verrucomicrobiota bacterium]
TSAGRYHISVRPENRDYQRLSQKYHDRGSADAEAEAAEMCLFKLQTYLADASDENKTIYPEDFLVQQIVERAAKEAILPASGADATDAAPAQPIGY